MEYVKLPDVVEAVQLTGLSECGCTPSFDVSIPSWLRALLSSKDLGGLPGRPDGNDPLGTLPRFGLANFPERSITVGGWIIRKRVRGSMTAFDTLSDAQFRAAYAPKASEPGSTDPIGTQADVEPPSAISLIQIASTTLERVISLLDVPHISDLSSQTLAKAVKQLKLARETDFIERHVPHIQV